MKFSLSMMALALSVSGMATAGEYPEDGWWWDAEASGRGYLVERQGDTMFIAAFHYAPDGSPEWLTIQGQYTPVDTPIDSIGTFNGEVYFNRDGQCLGCAYMAPATSLSSQGPAQIAFADNQHGTLTWSGESIPIERTFWGWQDSVGQLQGQWALLRTENGATTSTLVSIVLDGSPDVRAATISRIDNESAFGSIELTDGALTLTLLEDDAALALRMPESARFYAGAGNSSGVQVVALRLDDTPYAIGPGSSNGSTAAVLCPYDQSTLNNTLGITSESVWTCADGVRELAANGIPDHDNGSNFPNAIAEVPVQFTATTSPSLAATVNINPRVLGYALNGVKFDPGTAGACESDVTSAADCPLAMGTGPWRIEALGQETFLFRLDDNNAHVQPSGSYHYHGMPEGILSNNSVSASSARMLLIGWAPDGFPIYARYGYSSADDATSSLQVISGSYAIKATPDAGRPSIDLIPMGAFIQDYEYAAGSGDLDECNGRTGVTPEFADGIYHYYATDSYPYLPRCWKGTVN